MRESNKLFHEVVNQLQHIIQRDGLEAGDKLPSERELAERLGVGRSSIREALRALELLGVIETRRGEGTYMKRVDEHQLVELIGKFILKERHVQRDVIEVKMMIEKQAIVAAIRNGQLSCLLQEAPTDYNACFEQIVLMANNRLLERIWRIATDYCASFFPYPTSNMFFQNLMTNLRSRNVVEALSLYEETMNHSHLDKI